MSPFQWQCRCGSVSGEIDEFTPRTSNYVVCGCGSCQEYADWLSEDPSILDDWRGSHVFQISPEKIRLKKGKELIALKRITRKGPQRWYTTCCRTPIANTIESTWIPFTAVHRALIQTGHGAAEVHSHLGPLIARVNTPKRLYPVKPPKGSIVNLLVMLLRFNPMFFMWTMLRRQKHSPFLLLTPSEENPSDGS